MKKIVALLLGIPFFAVGAYMGYSIGTNLLDAQKMSEWTPVQAMVTDGGYKRHQSDGSSTFEAYIEYEYQVNGKNYRGNRVGISGGADNIGDYQTNTGNRLEKARSTQQPVTVYVDPDNPNASIYDREIRWELVGFKSIAVFGFGGFGLGLIIWTLLKKSPKDPNDPAFASAPWLANDAWQGDEIRSNAKSAMFMAWGLAAFWNVISAPIPFVVYPEIVEKGNHAAWLGLLFPAVGIGIIVWAVKRTREWGRFGPTPLTLDPFPGAIGGHVGGTIEVSLPYDAQHQFSMTLTCIKSYVTGSGKNRSRKESAEWQSSQLAQTTAGTLGTQLAFRFDVPDSLPQADATRRESTYYLWRLSVEADLPGIDLNRDYEIPVYPTGELSHGLQNASMDRAQDEQLGMDVDQVRKLVKFQQGGRGKAMLFPMGRNWSSGLMVSVIGVVFAATGWYLWQTEGELFIGSIFTFLGSLAALGGLYVLLNSLEITLHGGKLVSTRRILGLPVKRTSMSKTDFLQLRVDTSFKSQSGGKHTVHYSVDAVDRRGRRLRMGEGFKGKNQADAAIAFISAEFGLKSAASA